MLFYGPPGTGIQCSHVLTFLCCYCKCLFPGKTSTILACAKEIYSPQQFNSMVGKAWCYYHSAVPTRFWSWMLVMTGASELWGVRSSTLPRPGPSSTSEISCKLISANLINIFAQGLQADHTGWSRCHDQWCPKCAAEDHWKIHWECPVINSLFILAQGSLGVLCKSRVATGGLEDYRLTMFLN